MNDDLFDQNSEQVEVALLREHNSDLIDQIDQLETELALVNAKVFDLECEATSHTLYDSPGGSHGSLFYQIFELSTLHKVLVDKHGEMLAQNRACRELLTDQERSGSAGNIRSYMDRPSRISFLKLLRADDWGKDKLEVLYSFLFGGVYTVQLSKLDADYNGVTPVYLVTLLPVSFTENSSHITRLASLAIEQLKECVIITDAQQRILRVNQAFTEVTGYSAKEAIGQTPALLKSGRHGSGFYQEMLDHLNNRGWWAGEIWNRRKSGQIYPEWLQISRLFDEHSRQVFFIGTFSDITERKEHQQRLDRLAFFDSLTTLPNRLSLHNHLDSLLARLSENRPQLLAVMFLDLDKFKEVNDNFGHQEGDQVLRQASQRIIASIRSNDFVARIGGDEFVLVLPRVLSANAAEELAGRLVNQLSQPFICGENSHELSASVGIAFYPEHGLTRDDLMRRADAAMYSAKGRGRNQYMVFDPEEERQNSYIQDMLNHLKMAIEFPEKYVEMHYQPVIKVSDQSLAGYEALVRLKDDERLVMPFEFIGLAETSGLIQGLSFAIFRAICADLKRHRVSIDINVAVNLSPIQFKNPQLFEVLTEIAKEYGLSINQFSFEVTETATIENLDLMYESLVKMRESDVDVLLDDFGTGYASLSLLKDLPVDYIKIDRSFVSGLHESDDNAKLTEGLIAIAHALRLKTVAEGVETQAQYQWLAEQKVDLIQGYLFGKPSPMRDWVNQ